MLNTDDEKPVAMTPAMLKQVLASTNTAISDAIQALPDMLAAALAQQPPAAG